MARCTTCGRVNRDSAVFCQNCGKRLASDESQNPGAHAGAADRACPKCAAPNPGGMNFCKMCGTGLQGQGATPKPSPTAAASVDKRVCHSCRRETPAALLYCQHCGAKQAAPEEAIAQTVAVASGDIPVVAKEVTPVPGALLKPARQPHPGQPNATIAGVIGKESGELMAFAQAAAAAAVAVAVAEPAANTASVARPTGPDDDRKVAPQVDEPSFGRLVCMSPDGSEGAICELIGTQVDVGRHEGALTFPDDPYLARRHGRIEKRGAQVFASSLDDANGVYLRITGPFALRDGDRFLAGKEVFRFEELRSQEQDGSPALQHGVLLFGSPHRAPLGRLVQVTVVGVLRDTLYLSKPLVIVGREEGDLRYPDDDFLSRRHAEITTRDGKAWLRDLDSSNGTFIRVATECTLSPGDFLRMGNQLFRFDVPGE